MKMYVLGIQENSSYTSLTPMVQSCSAVSSGVQGISNINNSAMWQLSLYLNIATATWIMP